MFGRAGIDKKKKKKQVMREEEKEEKSKKRKGNIEEFQVKYTNFTSNSVLLNSIILLSFYDSLKINWTC